MSLDGFMPHSWNKSSEENLRWFNALTWLCTSLAKAEGCIMAERFHKITALSSLHVCISSISDPLSLTLLLHIFWLIKWTKRSRVYFNASALLSFSVYTIENHALSATAVSVIPHSSLWFRGHFFFFFVKERIHFLINLSVVFWLYGALHNRRSMPSFFFFFWFPYFRNYYFLTCSF